MATKRRPAPRRVATVLKGHKCKGGPWNGHTIYLDAYSDSNSGWFTIAGQVGRYTAGKWEALQLGAGH